MTDAAVGTLLREWRARRRLSQLDLSLAVGVSARHLGFVETGRSRPSAELLLDLAEGLGMPLRERNALLLAAGHAPRYSSRPLDDVALAPVREVVQRLLDAHDPYPGVVVDRWWDVVAANAAASALLVGLPPEVLAPRTNIYRVCLHPQGLAARTLNFAEWAQHLLDQLRRSIALTADPALQRLSAEVHQYDGVVELGRAPAPEASAPLLVPLVLDGGEGERMSLFSTLTTFGGPRDVTLDELAVELFWPADEQSAQLLRL